MSFRDNPVARDWEGVAPKSYLMSKRNLNPDDKANPDKANPDMKADEARRPTVRRFTTMVKPPNKELPIDYRSISCQVPHKMGMGGYQGI